MAKTKSLICAGIFTYGRTQDQLALNGKKIKRMPWEEWYTYLVNSHPDFITGEEKKNFGNRNLIGR